MADQSTARNGPIDRRAVLRVGAALAVSGPALLREANAAQRPPVVIDASARC